MVAWWGCRWHLQGNWIDEQHMKLIVVSRRQVGKVCGRSFSAVKSFGVGL